MSVGITLTRHEITNRWPHIQRFLRVEPSGRIEDDLHRWWTIASTRSPAEQAAGNDELADFYEFRLAQRAQELAADPSLRGLVEEWTESMAYLCRQCAAAARGEDPGEWIPQWERRPDLAAARKARVAKIVAELDAEPEPAEPTRHLRKAG